MTCSQRHHRKERFAHNWVTMYLGWSEGGFLTSVQDGVVECDLQENLAVWASISFTSTHVRWRFTCFTLSQPFRPLFADDGLYPFRGHFMGSRTGLVLILSTKPVREP